MYDSYWPPVSTFTFDSEKLGSSRIYLMLVGCSVGQTATEKKVAASSLLYRMSFKFVLLVRKIEIKCPRSRMNTGRLNDVCHAFP